MNLDELKIKVVDMLKEKKLTISTCESATAGGVASSICDVSGASKVLFESYIVYSNEAKIKILHIDKDLIDKYGVVSKEIAMCMAKNLYDITHTDICISITGNLGPDVLENKKAGLVYIGICINGVDITYYECDFKGDRLSVKNKVIEQTFILIYEFLKNL